MPMYNLLEYGDNYSGSLWNTPFAEFENIMCTHFDLTCAKVEEVNKLFASFYNRQALYLYTSFICTVPGIY